MINVAKEKAPQAKFEVMDMRKINLPLHSFDAIICMATLIHVDDSEAYKILEKFDALLKEKGMIIINVMEYLNGEKEIFLKELFNPIYYTYFNQYDKKFFLNWFSKKGYKIIDIIDNPIFNTEQVTEISSDTN